MSLVALIPARGGSKGIPRKNIRLFCGKPLLQWSIDATLASACVDQVLVSTDDPEIAEVAMACGAEVPFLRPAGLASDTAPGIAPVLHALERLPQVSDVLMLQPTSPLRTSVDIEAIVAMRKRPVRSLRSHSLLVPSILHGCITSNNQLMEPLLHFDSASYRQQLPPAYVLNGALYLASRAFLLRERAFIAADTMGYLMPAERSVDIDTLLDWQWAEFLMEHQA